MWRNVEVAEFVALAARVQRRARDREPKAGFYGLDLYSLHPSMEAVVEYLDGVDPEAAQRARQRYACFDQFGRDPQVYAYEAGIGGAEPCEQQAVQQLVELQAMARRIARRQRAHRRGRATSSPSRTRGWWSTPRSTTGRCSAAASRAGTCATGTWPRRWTSSSPTSRPRSAAGEGRRVGAQLAPRRRARDGAGAGRASSTSASSCARGTATRRCSSASPRTRAP